jgi:diguanylate cyclase (GGDEF)-like protein
VTTALSRVATRWLDTDDDLEVMRRVAAAMFLLGGLTSLIGAQSGIASPDAKSAQEAISVVLAGTGGVLLFLRRPSRATLLTTVLWSVVLISALVAVADPVKRVDFFYLWPVLFAAYFFSVPVVAVVYGSMVLSLVAALALHPGHPSAIDSFLSTMVTVGLVTALVAGMTRQQTRLRGQLATAADTDPLTGLLNRRGFNPRLDQSLRAARTNQRPLSVVMFDLDHFKRLNDQHGHLVGDQVLEAFGQILHRHTRDDDLLCRFGGEEFAVGLPGANADDARRFTERVAAALVAGPDGTPLVVTVSAGISILTGDDREGESLIQRADEALYAAKAAGRCRFATFDGTVEVGPRFGEPAPR